MSVWAYFILGIVAASVVWMAVCWLLLNQRDAARSESTYLRVARPHPEVRRRLRYGDSVTSAGANAWPPTGTTTWHSSTVTTTKES